MSSADKNSEVEVENVAAAEEKAETKEVKGVKRPADVSTTYYYYPTPIQVPSVGASSNTFLPRSPSPSLHRPLLLILFHFHKSNRARPRHRLPACSTSSFIMSSCDFSANSTEAQ